MKTTLRFPECDWGGMKLVWGREAQRKGYPKGREEGPWAGEEEAGPSPKAVEAQGREADGGRGPGGPGEAATGGTWGEKRFLEDTSWAARASAPLLTRRAGSWPRGASASSVRMASGLEEGAGQVRSAEVGRFSGAPCGLTGEASVAARRAERAPGGATGMGQRERAATGAPPPQVPPRGQAPGVLLHKCPSRGLYVGPADQKSSSSTGFSKAMKPRSKAATLFLAEKR